MNPTSLANELQSPVLLRWSLLTFVTLFLLLMERAAEWQGRRRACRLAAPQGARTSDAGLDRAAPSASGLGARFVHHRPLALLVLPLLFWLAI